jgi:thermitase
VTRRLLVILLGFTLSVPAWAQKPTTDHVLNRLLAQHRNGARADDVKRALWANAQVVGQIPQLNIHILQVPEQAADHAAAALEKSGQFTSLERDSLAQANTTTPNDPYFTSQRHLPKISAPNAWDVSTGLSSITIGVIDSGVQPDRSGSCFQTGDRLELPDGDHEYRR